MENFQQVLLRFPRYTILALLLSVVMISCTKPKKKIVDPDGKEVMVREEDESLVSGDIRIGIDQTMMPVLKQIVDAFHATYSPRANLRVVYKPEGQLVMDLANDSLRMIIIGRDITPEEARPIVNAKITPKVNVIGQDAIALLVNKDNPIDRLSYAQLGKIVRGEIRTWKALGEGGPEGEISIVFDDPLSGTVSFVQSHFMEDSLPENDAEKKLPENAYTAGGHENLIEYVEKTPNALGLIGLSWIADRDHPRVRDFLSRVQLVRMLSPDSVDLPNVYVQPYQNEITLHRYPLWRRIYAVSREHFSGLGTGFVVFAAGELGQRILLKAGLVPAYMQPRTVIFPEKED